MIAIVDYKAGNLTSVKLAFEALARERAGSPPRHTDAIVVTSDPSVIAAADRVVFPGVGAAASAMANLRELDLVDVVKAAANSGKPFLGICLGMQILFDHTEEDGGVDTLGILHGQVRRFPTCGGTPTPASQWKVPEIGWNSAESVTAPRREGAAGTSLGEYYFVHSYYAEVVPETALTTEYAGVTFTAMVKKGKLWACQFHPEKSGRLGLELLKEWLAC